MSSTCPNGHESEWADWCSVCGERLSGDAPDAGGAAVPDPPVAVPDPSTPPSPDAPQGASQPSGPTCDNCGVARRPHDVFCESCGYDFASGSLPESGTDGDPAATETATAMHVVVTVDPDFFAASVGDVDLALPDPLPDAQLVPLAGIRVLIGRHSTSRGIFPEIDVLALTEDPAVSSRHAMLERDAANNWTVTDLGSTNGTFLTPQADQAIASGTALPVAVGTRLYLGAWTCIELAGS